MVSAGISQDIIKSLGVKVVAPIKTKECPEMAKDLGCIKAQAAINLGVRDDVGIVVIGNAEIICLESRLEVIIRRLPKNMNCNNISFFIYE